MKYPLLSTTKSNDIRKVATITLGLNEMRDRFVIERYSHVRGETYMIGTFKVNEEGKLAAELFKHYAEEFGDTKDLDELRKTLAIIGRAWELIKTFLPKGLLEEAEF